jgi:hypothetical protein
MSRESSGGQAFFWKLVDRLTALCLQIGGPLFVILTAYLLWGVYNGDFVYIDHLKGTQLAHASAQIQLIITLMMASGVLTLLSAAYQFSGEETVGYLILIAGALLRWGVAALAGVSRHSISPTANSTPAHIVAQYMLLGLIAALVCAPFILGDVWERLRGTRHWIKESTTATARRQFPKVGAYVFCWDTQFCREHMRKACGAYDARKSCWRIKSGCYCGEDRIIRALNAAHPTNQQPGRKPSVLHDELTPAERRNRCRECFLYKNHQESKYRILSPLMFPLTYAILYFSFKTVWRHLHDALLLADKLSKHISYLPGIAQGKSPEWANVSAASSPVEWLFVGLLGMVLLTYLLRLLEYLVFDLQI